jgi:hypothetical protein
MRLNRSRRRAALGRKLLILAQGRGSGVSLREPVTIMTALSTMSVRNTDVLNAVFTFYRVVNHSCDAINLFLKAYYEASASWI